MATKQATPAGKDAVDHEAQKTKYDYDYAGGWKPSEGDVIEGIIDSIDSGTSEYGVYPIVTILKDDGEKEAVHCFHTALRSQLARAKPEVGQPIGIKYLGKQEQKNSDGKRSSYDNYRVVIKGAKGGYDWSQEPDFTPSAQEREDADNPLM